MPDIINRYINQLIARWKSFDSSQKVRAVMSIVIVAGSLALAVFFVTKPNYEKIVTGTSKEVGEMSKILTETNIPHKLGDSNTSISVEGKDKDNAQIALAQSGYLNDGIKFEDSLNLITFSTTESDKKKIFKEYYESKIASQLKKMNTISDAVVNLSIPEKSVFIGDDGSDKPTASVTITPRGTLTDAQVEGVARVVSSSVERLNPNDVTIVDNSGNVLNSIDNNETGISNKQIQLQAQRKKEIEKQVSQLLTDVTDNVRVVANIICDFNQEKTTSVEYESPMEGSDSGILRSQEISKENVQNMDSSSIPGTDSNQGTGATIASTGTESSYNKQQSTSSYEINQTNREIIKGLGNVDGEKSSVTVSLLYGVKFADAPTDEVTQNITKMVSTATGINENRITVASFKILPTEAVKASINWMLVFEKAVPYTPYLIALIIIFVMIAFVSKLKVSFSSSGAFQGGEALKGAVIDFSTRDEETIKELDNNSEVKKQIGKFIEKQPDIAAGMLRNWIYENEKNQS